MSLDFTGKRAIVCGGSRGIGRAIALGLAQAGADVSICARGAEALEATRTEIAAHGHKAHAGSADLGDAAAVRGYVGQAAEVLGVSISTVQRRLYRAVLALAKELDHLRPPERGGARHDRRSARG